MLFRSPEGGHDAHEQPADHGHQRGAPGDLRLPRERRAAQQHPAAPRRGAIVKPAVYEQGSEKEQVIIKRITRNAQRQRRRDQRDPGNAETQTQLRASPPFPIECSLNYRVFF